MIRFSLCHHFLTTSLLALGADYCALTVEVVQPGGPANGVMVLVQEQNGRADAKSTTQSGEVFFCDLGVSSVTITVGSSGCQSIMKDVRMVFGVETKLRIHYDRMPCIRDTLGTILPCSLLLRFRNDNNEWIPDVRLNPTLPKFPNVKSDRYGRAIAVFDLGELHLMTDAPGYLASPIELRCPNQPYDRERIITLKRSDNSPK